MERQRLILAAVVTMLIVPSMMASAAHPGFGRKETEVYYSPTQFPGPTVCNQGGPDMNGACFSIHSGEFNTTFNAEDCCQANVGGTYRFLDSFGLVVGSGTWCNHSPWLIIPSAAVELRVNLDNAASLANCGFSTSGSPNGTITAWFW